MSSKKEVQKIIHDNIRYKREDKLLNHFSTILDRDYDNYSGILKGNEFTLWRYDRWSGILYPVIYGNISEIDDIATVNIITKMNPFGFLLFLLIALGIFISTLFNTNNQDSILDFFRISIVTLLLIVAMRLGYRHQRKVALAELVGLIKEKAADSQINLL